MSVRTSEVSFGGYDCVKIENGELEIWMTKTVGPRILGLAFQGGQNIFAELPGVALSTPTMPDYIVRGGHRLWCAPEEPTLTYAPDNDPVAMEFLEGTLHMISPADESNGVQKTMSVNLDPNDARVSVIHSLTNIGSETIELAPWAITQLRPGGVGIMPQKQGNADAYGLLPNRQLVLWPYSQMKSSHVDWGDDFIFIHANFSDGLFKVGFPNPRGWLGYAIDGLLFVKKATYFPGAIYYDMGSSSECYCDSRFIELETLGPKVRLEPGQAVHHREDWYVFGEVAFQPDEDSTRELALKLGLE